MNRFNRTQRLTACLLAVTVVSGAAGLVAMAGPQLSAAAEPIDSAAPYTVTCWQEGREVLSDTSDTPLTALDIRSDTSIGLGTADGNRSTLVALGEALCIVTYSER